MVSDYRGYSWIMGKLRLVKAVFKVTPNLLKYLFVGIVHSSLIFYLCKEYFEILCLVAGKDLRDMGGVHEFYVVRCVF